MPLVICLQLTAICLNRSPLPLLPPLTVPRSFLRTCTSRLIFSRCLSSCAAVTLGISSDFLMLFTANCALLLLRSSMIRTDPKPPWPISLPILYFDSMDLLGKPQSSLLIDVGIGAASQTSTRVIPLISWLEAELRGGFHLAVSTCTPGLMYFRTVLYVGRANQEAPPQYVFALLGRHITGPALHR